MLLTLMQIISNRLSLLPLHLILLNLPNHTLRTQIRPTALSGLLHIRCSLLLPVPLLRKHRVFLLLIRFGEDGVQGFEFPAVGLGEVEVL